MRRAKFIIPMAVGALLPAALAYAAGGGEAHEIPWGNFLFRVINFAVFLFLLWKFFGKKILDFFGGRQSGIKKDLEDLETRKVEAQRKLSEVEKRIANIEQEKAAILDEARKQGEALKQAIIAKAEKSAALITEQAHRTAANEAKVEIERMRAQMAELVVEAARKLVEAKLTEAGHEKLVDEYLTKVVLN